MNPKVRVFDFSTRVLSFFLDLCHIFLPNLLLRTGNIWKKSFFLGLSFEVFFLWVLKYPNEKPGVYTAWLTCKGLFFERRHRSRRQVESKYGAFAYSCNLLAYIFSPTPLQQSCGFKVCCISDYHNSQLRTLFPLDHVWQMCVNIFTTHRYFCHNFKLLTQKMKISLASNITTHNA